MSIGLDFVGRFRCSHVCPRSKTAAARRDFGIEPCHCTGEPHTWREILQVVHHAVPLANQTVGLQQYGQPNASSLAGLEVRGATVINLRLYHWELPEDTAAAACLVA